MPKPPKSYKNLSFLGSPDARVIRILSEYLEPEQRFREQQLEHTIVMFGSARTQSRENATRALDDARAALEAAAADTDRTDLEEAVSAAEAKLRASRYYEDTRELARRLTEWSMERSGLDYVICTGGGPGIMEAGNRGASEVPGGRSVGLGISLPFEKDVNHYVPAELAFEFHYFFMRKYWFMYLAKAMVVCPGGFGTLDEFAELLTLRQTRKITKALPIVLYGDDYWDHAINFDAMVEAGTISAADLNLFHRSDSVDDAFDYLTDILSQLEAGTADMALPATRNS